jgi:prevent-host-death family protein
MQDRKVSIGEVKCHISELVNQVAYGGERILLTARGKPKAALISIEDYTRLLEQERVAVRGQWQAWMRRADDLSQRILSERSGEPLHIERVIESAKADREARHDDIFHH